MLVQIIIVVVILLVAAVVLVIIGLRNPRTVNEDALQDRLMEYTQSGEEISLEKIEMSQPFSERVIYPLARKLGDIAIRFTPQNQLQNVARRLELAGNPGKLEPATFLVLQFAGVGFFGGIILLVSSIGTLEWPFGRVLLLIVGFGAVGFYFPSLWLTSKINRRQKEVRRSMPDALDLLTICVEAGLGFDAAMSKVAEKWETQLSFAFTRVIQEVQLGKPRREALRDMADRLGVSELSSFVAAVIQSEQLGVSLSKVLRIQADQMRTKRRQLAEEEAHKAPIKMLIPMALMIMPALFIVLMTPAGLKLMHSMLGGMF